MKFTKFILFILIVIISCSNDDEELIANHCNSSFDCPIGLYCIEHRCSEKIEEHDEDSNALVNDNSNNDEDSDSVSNDSDHSEVNDNDNVKSDEDTTQSIVGDCVVGETQKCPYQGMAETENVGPCKAAVRTCNENSKWGRCEGEVTPVSEYGTELCNNGIDDDCNGTIDDGTDFDGDGVGACSDCCESTDICPKPKEVWDSSIHNCSYKEDINYECEDFEISSTNPIDYAKAIGLCDITTSDSNKWGLIEAKISAPDESTSYHEGSNALLSALGNIIKPQHGQYMLGLGTGIVANPFESYEGSFTTAAPADWVELNNGSFPAAESCSSSGTSGSVNDAVMLTLKIRTPQTAKSFSFNIYFLTYEYPTYICTQYNDFFIALLDSKFESNDENLKNPYDKNLAMDSLGNPVGVNLAPAGLFTQCQNKSTSTYEVTSCIGTDELEGTGFVENGWLGLSTTYHGGTGWLTTRGNVKGGEIITLRLAIWDLSDHRLDSLVLIDNFQWNVEEVKPGTGQY